MKNEKYVYHITSTVITDKDDFVTAYNIEEAVEKYISWFKEHININILSSDILTVQRIGNNLGE